MSDIISGFSCFALYVKRHDTCREYIILLRQLSLTIRYLSNCAVAEKYKLAPTQNEWFIFTPRDKKAPKGKRPNRVAGIGYWRANGADKPVKKNGKIVGFKRSLVFHKSGGPSKGIKTNWLMQEYTLFNGPARKKRDRDDIKVPSIILYI